METLSDYGPIYAETDLSQFPVEPCNTFSNILFLLAALHWARRIDRQASKDFKLYLRFGLPLLLTGFVGGTVYHATRSHFGWMLMDVIPIYLIGLLTGVYQWKLIRYSFQQTLVILLAVVILPLFVLWKFVPPSDNTPTLGYLILALSVIVPLVIDQIRTQWKYAVLFFRPCFLIAIALCFRALDSTSFVQTNIPVGTHFLWHTFGGMTCHYLLVFMEERSKN